jgi:DNA-binding NtrC family response regulator
MNSISECLIHSQSASDTDHNKADIAPEIIGNSTEMHGLKRRIAQFARLNIPVLIMGESGTGKELVAKAIHNNSPRSSQPFIAVNCGAFPAALIESELFGHTQGSFTGATKTKNGLVDAAEGGTLFLDEIGELPLTSQCVFLRMLDSGDYYRIGESYPQKANVRIVSATNRNLEVMAQEGTFRGDLFFRLKGAQLSLAPLRLRKSEIPDLVKHILKDCMISQPALKILMSMEWPGNIRELKMVLSSLKSICSNNEINVTDIEEITQYRTEPTINPVITSFHLEKEAAITKFEEQYLSRLLSISNDNLSKAATIAGLTRKHLRSLLKKANLYKAPIY